jgi:cellulose synthase/poly-beta-1,6-N-acetylglucosamine synthase-like glycosyltransferase
MVGMAALARAAGSEIIVRLDADTMPADDAIARLSEAIAHGASVAVGANDPVLERRTFASLSAEFAAHVVERLKATSHTESYAVGRLVAYRTAALRRLTFPAHIINEDHYSAISIVRSGGTAVYEPAARCKFRVPLTFGDYQNQSRRILEGVRQLERIGVRRVPLPVVLHAIASSARAQPLHALCWALAYALSSVQPPPERCQPWPISRTTKGTVA